jgi:mannose-6-phosphate isomerase-like protein (cupin superfamily)
MRIGNLDDAEPFVTLDGSVIREVAGPVSLPSSNQSLAEATVPVGGATAAHLHRTSEEVYFFTAGRGRLRIGAEERDVLPGDCAVIPPGTEHKLRNMGDDPLVLLCCCSPPYADADTVVTEPSSQPSRADVSSRRSRGRPR